MSGDAPSDVIFEITRIGDTQRVAAIDVASGVEVVVQAPANAALADVRALALRKLERALGSLDGKQEPRPPRKGTLA
ncbi:hypothetical protein U91I_03134 [alpha proteobacterium U9-1i]|nr:hypothetical protein U91I_03134 [alpha proteobacterium U9-1i]